MNGYLIALIIFMSYFALLIIGKKLGLWKRLNIDLYGPLLMWKTRRGRDFIERLASRRRFWSAYGRVSTGVCIGSMVALMALLIYQAFIVMEIPRSAAPSPELILGIPGINPIIPVGYGILGLALAIVVHEFAHGILSRVGKIDVESMGVLLLVVPVGAFVEPNEEQIKAAKRKVRMRLFSAGPATNMFVAAICLVLLLLVFGPAIEPASDGAVVTGVVQQSPAQIFGLSVWSEIVGVNGSAVRAASELQTLSFPEPGELVEVRYLYNGEELSVSLPGGVVVASVVPGLPADSAGLRPGMIIKELNDRTIHNLSGLRSVTESAPAHRPINITVLSSAVDDVTGETWFFEDPDIRNITLTSKWLYYEVHFPDLNRDEYRNMSYMGVTSTIFGVVAQDTEYLLQLVARPFSNVESLSDLTWASLRYIALPFLGYSPMSAPAAALYQPSGVLSVMPDALFWLLFNALYWIFWLNLAIGLFNSLPATPLDGGYVFKDMLKGVMQRFSRKDIGIEGVVQKPSLTEAQVDKIIGTISLLVSLTVLFLIVWQLVGPRL